MRDLEEGIAGAVAIEATTPLIITEGNYLLMEDGAWAQVRGVLDEAWYLDIDSTLRQQRLLERHMRFGRSQEAALEWIRVTDEPNAQRIERTRHRDNDFRAALNAGRSGAAMALGLGHQAGHRDPDHA